MNNKFMHKIKKTTEVYRGTLERKKKNLILNPNIHNKETKNPSASLVEAFGEHWGS